MSEAAEFDWAAGAMAEGLAAYRAGNFFLAHEYWEEHWRQCRPPSKTFVQALIQLACAMHHHQHGNRRGAASQLDHALVKLQGFPASYGSLDVSALRDEIAGWIVALAGDAALTSPPVPTLHIFVES